MGLSKITSPICPKEQHCWNWTRKYMNYCLCSTRDKFSLTLGFISVISWGVAEIPQIITNYKEKSTEGLSIAFLMTWIIGDLLNFVGCMLEPATLPTQYYMAILFTMTTLILTMQAIYYNYIYPQLKSVRKYDKPNQAQSVDEKRQCSADVVKEQVNSIERSEHEARAVASRVPPSSPIPLPVFPRDGSLARESYYMSARSLSRSHTPTAGSFPVQKQTTLAIHWNSIEEPLLHAPVPVQSAPPSKTKTLQCVVSAVTLFLGTLNLQLLTEKSGVNMFIVKQNQGLVIQLERRLLQESGSLLKETQGRESSWVGTYLGWGMAAIYMGGRLPQICLNIKRGQIEGLNPLMFMFAVVGNATYVGSILINSLDWLKIRPNLPWLADAGGCIFLDTFILIQFIYFRYGKRRQFEIKHGHSDDTRLENKRGMPQHYRTN